MKTIWDTKPLEHDDYRHPPQTILSVRKVISKWVAILVTQLKVGSTKQNKWHEHECAFKVHVVELEKVGN